MAAVGNSPWITFLAILDQYRFFKFFWNFLQKGCRWPFWMSENHFRDLISGHFRSIHNFNFFFWNFWQNGWRRPFFVGQFTFDRISGHFRSIGHFVFPKFTFDRNSGHFRSIQNFIFFPAVILDVWKSLWIAFLTISDWSAILDVRNSLSMAFLAISVPYGTLFFKFLTKWPYTFDTQLFFDFFLTKWPPAAILDGTTVSIIELVREIWMSNACVKFEERTCSLNPSKVITLTTKLWRGRWRGGGGCVADENIIFPKTYVSREYNY